MHYLCVSKQMAVRLSLTEMQKWDLKFNTRNSFSACIAIGLHVNVVLFHVQDRQSNSWWYRNTQRHHVTEVAESISLYDNPNGVIVQWLAHGVGDPIKSVATGSNSSQGKMRDRFLSS